MTQLRGLRITRCSIWRNQRVGGSSHTVLGRHGHSPSRVRLTRTHRWTVAREVPNFEANARRLVPPGRYASAMVEHYACRPVHVQSSDCAQFCAHPRSKTMALGSNGTGRQIACIGAENQHDSKSSHWVGKASAATVNRRVASPLRRNGFRPWWAQNQAHILLKRCK